MMVAVVGAAADIAGYGLAGAVLCPAETDAEVRSALAALAAEVGLVILTNSAAGALFDGNPPDTPGGSAPDSLRQPPDGRLVAVMPL